MWDEVHTDGVGRKDGILTNTRKRLLSLSAQKFISDLSRDAFHFAKLRVNGTTAGRGRPATAVDRNRVVLTMDDLSLALSEHGVNVKKPDYCELPVSSLSANIQTCNHPSPLLLAWSVTPSSDALRVPSADILSCLYFPLLDHRVSLYQLNQHAMSRQEKLECMQLMKKMYTMVSPTGPAPCLAAESPASIGDAI